MIDPHGDYRTVPRAFRDAVWRYARGTDPVDDDMRQLRAALLTACAPRRIGRPPIGASTDPDSDGRPRRKGRPRRGRVWRLTLPAAVERQPGAPTVIVACTLSVCRGPAWMAEHLAAHGYRPVRSSPDDDWRLVAPGRPILFPAYFTVDDANAVDRPEEWQSLCRAIESRNENPTSVTQADGRDIR